MDDKPEWSPIVIATSVALLCSIENSIINMGEWPYLRQLDPLATSSFFGLVSSTARLGHALFVFAFAYWAHRQHVTKLPLLAGRLVTLLGCILYLLIEYVPNHRRYALLLCYFLFGIGFSTAALLRSYVAAMSSHANRAPAYAMLNAATVLSLIIGPLAQLAFSSIPYPGYEILPGMRFHIYSAPIWFALITNLIVIAVLIFLFEDPPIVEKSLELKSNSFSDLPSSPSSSSLVSRSLSHLRSAPFAWSLVVLLVFEKFASHLTLSTISVLAGPMMTSVFAFRGETTVIVMAVAQFFVGILAVVLTAMFVFCKLGKRVNSRVLFLFSNIIFLVGYVVSFPWDFVTVPHHPYNATTRTGCNEEEYKWCATSRATVPYAFVPVLIVVIGLAFPSSNISIDSIYSKLLGPGNQNLMQGVIVVAEDIMMILGPIYASQIFTRFGIDVLWPINAAVVLISSTIWIAAWKHLKPYH